MAIRPFTPFPPPPLKFRTAGFPNYGFKQAVRGALRHLPMALTRPQWLFRRRTFFFRSRTCVRRHARLRLHTPAQRPLAPPRFYCPLASSLTMAASELLSVTAGFCSLCHRLHDRQKFPNLLRQGLIPCRRPYSGGSQAPITSRAPGWAFTFSEEVRQPQCSTHRTTCGPINEAAALT